MLYDEWKTDCVEHYQENTCHHCENKQNKLNEAKHFMEEIVKQLYTKEPINLETLDHCISEICHYLDIKLGIESLQIERKKTISYISEWMQDSNQFLKNLK